MALKNNYSRQIEEAFSILPEKNLKEVKKDAENFLEKQNALRAMWIAEEHIDVFARHFVKIWASVAEVMSNKEQILSESKKISNKEKVSRKIKIENTIDYTLAA